MRSVGAVNCSEGAAVLSPGRTVVRAIFSGMLGITVALNPAPVPEPAAAPGVRRMRERDAGDVALGLLLVRELLLREPPLPLPLPLYSVSC